jgi:hypothetical protein
MLPVAVRDLRENPIASLVTGMFRGLESLFIL